ncbi:MAG TPA: hypothetical protein VF710_04910 [Longimicrobium sp.]|jgi:hypothetical protein
MRRHTWVIAIVVAGCATGANSSSRLAASPNALVCVRQELGRMGYSVGGGGDGAGWLEGRKEVNPYSEQSYTQIVEARMTRDDGRPKLEARGRRVRSSRGGRGIGTGPLGGFGPRQPGSDTTRGVPGLRRNRDAPESAGAAARDASALVRNCATWMG